MPRFKIKYTEEKIEQLIREGRGQGEGKDYIPWLKVGDFSSRGRQHRVSGIKFNRIHHLFSDLEKQYLYILMWEDDVYDIREQFPLFPVSNTENIAKEIGVKHPINIGLQNSMVMTTDFLITSKIENTIILKARSIKYQKDLENPRTREKLAIERVYWEERDVEWKVVTENSFDRNKAKRIEHLLGYYNNPFSNICSANENVFFIQDLTLCLYEHGNEKIKDLCLLLDRKSNMDDGSFLSLFFHLSAIKYIPIKIETGFRSYTKVSDYVYTEKLAEIIKKGMYDIAIG